MGACVSSHHKSSTMKVHRSSSSNRKPDYVIRSSPVNVKLRIGNGHVAVKPQLPLPTPLHSTANSRDFGSKEETFFDSQAWLESDCESEFMSVNGEFTPSRGSTPVNHHLAATTAKINGGAPANIDHKLFIVSQPSTSSVKKSKRLLELFHESQRENRNCDEEDGEPANENEMAVRGGALKTKRGRLVEIVRVQGCLPRVLSRCRVVTTQQMEVKRK